MYDKNSGLKSIGRSNGLLLYNYLSSHRGGPTIETETFHTIHKGSQGLEVSRNIYGHTHTTNGDDQTPETPFLSII